MKAGTGDRRSGDLGPPMRRHMEVNHKSGIQGFKCPGAAAAKIRIYFIRSQLGFYSFSSDDHFITRVQTTSALIPHLLGGSAAAANPRMAETEEQPRSC